MRALTLLLCLLTTSSLAGSEPSVEASSPPAEDGAEAQAEAVLPVEAIGGGLTLEDLDLRAPLDQEPSDATRALVEEANAAYDASHLVEAAELRMEAYLARRTALGEDHPATVGVKEGLAVMFRQLGDPAQARTMLERALAVRRLLSGEDDPKTAWCHNQLGIVAQEVGDPERARAHLQAARRIYRLHPGEADSALGVAQNLAVVEGSLGHGERALELLGEALSDYEAAYGPDSPRLVNLLGNIGSRAIDLGLDDVAIGACTRGRALALEHFGRGHRRTISVQTCLARAHASSGMPWRARMLFEDALADLEPDRVPLGVRYELGMLYGDFLDRTGDPAAVGVLEDALALATDAHGARHPDALRLRRVLTRARLNQLGAEPPAAAVEALVAEADDVVQASREVSPDGHPDVLWTELVRLHVLVTLGLDERADRALAEIDAGPMQGTPLAEQPRSVLEVRAAVLEQLDRWEEVIQVRRILLDRARNDPARALLVPVEQMWLALDLARVGRQDEAVRLADAALQTMRTRLEALTRSAPEADLIDQLEAWETAVHAWLSIRDEEVDARTAWDGVLALRGAGQRTLAYRERVSRDDARARELTEALQSVRGRMSASIAALSRTDQASSEDLDALRRMGRDKARLEQARAERLAELGAPPGLEVDLDAVCQNLPDDAVLVDFVSWLHAERETGANGTWELDAFVMRGGDCAVSRLSLGPTAQVSRAVRRWRRAVTAVGAPAELGDIAGRELTALVWEPLRAHVDEAEQVFLVPDAELGLVAWPALPHPDGGYLLEHHTVHLVSDVGRLAMRAPRSRARGALLVGDVDYGAGRGLPTPGEALPERPEGSMLAMRSGCLGRVYAPLPGTAAELSAVRPHLGRSLTLRGGEATPEAVMDAMPRHRIVHLATHGFFLSEHCTGTSGQDSIAAGRVTDRSPLAMSGLALAGANRLDPGPTDGASEPDALDQADGLLTGEELVSLDLSDTELVVLSACDTGLGETTSGQGVLGLRWALSLAGAHHQLFSLWAVPDAETATLMTDVYEALGRGRPCRRCGPAAALRHAQLQALARQRAEGAVDVRAWGAFVASGAP